MKLNNILKRTLVATVALSLVTQAFAARTTTYYHNDGLGSVVAATNEAGAVLWRKDYAPFGEQIDTTPETERMSYTGKQHDDATGLTYFGGRYYDPQVARFMSVDPVAFVEDNTMSFNRYLYVNNNPYKYVDPDGEFLNFVAKFVLDVAVNVAFNYATSGSIGIGAALKESAMGLLNPAKTLVKMKKLAGVLAKVNKKVPCSLSCFVAGTTVLTEFGYVPIELLEEGDKVWAHDPDTGVTALKSILRTFVNTKDSVWTLVIEKSGLRYTHEVTGSHPYYVVDAQGKGGWIDVANLQVGALLKTEGGIDAHVVSLHDTGEVLTTYNFEVADIHTYYVSAAKVLVHNCSQKAGKVGGRAKNHHREAPEAEGRPHTSYRTDSDGKVTSYETYNHPAPGQGKRVDVTGASHNGVPTPHVTDTTKHVNPRDPTKFGYTEGPTRPALPSEIPRQ
jgi:RHS repeat-associated protein